MRRWLKGAAVALLALLLLLALLVVGGRLWALKKRVRVVDVPAPALALAEGDAAVRRGRCLYESRGCSNCHGLDAAGRVYARSDDGVELAAPNLTPGGVVARYTGSDWTRAVRHGAAARMAAPSP